MAGDAGFLWNAADKAMVMVDGEAFGQALILLGPRHLRPHEVLRSEAMSTLARAIMHWLM
ncbi:hypothetical protein [Sphingomonas sp.]|uniref:hypothetical protein n=1 Tax=Sphingomonas sp. TaxID=28214 RepID=UPI0025FE00EA|nr:hypothetical protein [Sphingomonas sp.]